MNQAEETFAPMRNNGLLANYYPNSNSNSSPFEWFLGHCGRVGRPIAMKFCTHIAMIGAHRFIWV